MEEKEIIVSLEDMRKMLEKFKGATLYQSTIENIMRDMKLNCLQSLPHHTFSRDLVDKIWDKEDGTI